MALTSLGTENEKDILKEFDALIKVWSLKLNGKVLPYVLEPEQLERSVAYLWQHRKEKKERDYDNYLSAHDLGPYGGR